MNARNVVVRSISGSVYVLMVAFAILTHHPAIYVSLFSLFILVGIWEYSRLVQNNRTRPLRTILDGLAAAYIFSATLFSSISGPDRVTYAPYIFYLLYVIVRNLFTEKEGFPGALGKTLLGQIYIAGGLSMANFIAFSSNSMNFEDFRMPLLFSIFVMIWLNDTGAFLVGSLFGQHKLCPSISPKKTWEGWAGGVIMTMIGAMLLATYYLKSDAPLYLWGIIGLVVATAATWGDLLESRLKRSAGVKDSGRIIPGHGGILDRIDSALLVLPITYIALNFLGL